MQAALPEVADATKARQILVMWLQFLNCCHAMQRSTNAGQPLLPLALDLRYSIVYYNILYCTVTYHSALHCTIIYYIVENLQQLFGHLELKQETVPAVALSPGSYLAAGREGGFFRDNVVYRGYMGIK